MIKIRVESFQRKEENAIINESGLSSKKFIFTRGGITMLVSRERAINEAMLLLHSLKPMSFVTIRYDNDIILHAKSWGRLGATFTYWTNKTWNSNGEMISKALLQEKARAILEKVV